MYTKKNLSLVPNLVSAQALTSATDVLVYSVHSHCDLARALFKISTATVSTGNIVVQFVKRPTTGSATGEVVLVTLNIPGGATLGQTYYKDAPTNTSESGNALFAGQELIVRVFTAAAGGGAAGAGYGLAVVTESPEMPANEPNLILSS